MKSFRVQIDCLGALPFGPYIFVSLCATRHGSFRILYAVKSRKIW